MKRTAIVCLFLLCVVLLVGCGFQRLLPPADRMTPEAAEEIVFQRAGVIREEVLFCETELEFDDDWQGWQYEIEFTTAENEYDCEVNAVHGTVLNFYFEKRSA